MNLKTIGSYTLLVIYLAVLAVLAVQLASNIIALMIEVVGGAVTFTVLAGILAAYVPHLKSSFANVLTIFDSMKGIARLQVRWRVEGAVNDFREKMDDEIRGLLPYPMILNWVVSDEDVRPYVDEEKLVVVVRMKPRAEEQWNLASATLAYVSVGLINEARLHMTYTFSRAVDFAFTKKLLEDEAKIEARNYLVQQEILPVIAKDDEVREYYGKLLTISEELLNRVFLREVGNVAIKLAHILPGGLSKDILDFLDWSVALVERVGEEIPLWFSGKHLKVGCILVAKRDTFLEYGTEPYVRRAKEHLSRGADAVYVLSRGHSNCAIAHVIGKEIEDLDFGLRKVEGTDRKYDVRLEHGVTEALALLFRPVLAHTAS